MGKRRYNLRKASEITFVFGRSGNNNWHLEEIYHSLNVYESRHFAVVQVNFGPWCCISFLASETEGVSVTVVSLRHSLFLCGGHLVFHWWLYCLTVLGNLRRKASVHLWGQWFGKNGYPKSTGTWDVFSQANVFGVYLGTLASSIPSPNLRCLVLVQGSLTWCWKT